MSACADQLRLVTVRLQRTPEIHLRLIDYQVSCFFSIFSEKYQLKEDASGNLTIQIHGNVIPSLPVDNRERRFDSARLKIYHGVPGLDGCPGRNQRVPEKYVIQRQKFNFRSVQICVTGIFPPVHGPYFSFMILSIFIILIFLVFHNSGLIILIYLIFHNSGLIILTFLIFHNSGLPLSAESIPENPPELPQKPEDNT